MRQNKKIWSLIISSKFDLCLLQEIKRECIDEETVTSLWDHKIFDWIIKSSIGLSAEMVINWKRDLFEVNFSFVGDG